MVYFNRVRRFFSHLQWKLTLSYTSVTIGALLVTVLILGTLFYSLIMAPYQFLTPEFWLNSVSNNIPSTWRYVISKQPVDPELLSSVLAGQEYQISYFDLFRFGDLQLTARTMGQANIVILSPEEIVLGTSNFNWIPEEALGMPLDRDILPGLEIPIGIAMAGKINPEKMFVGLRENEEFYFTFPINELPDNSGQVLAIGIFYVTSLPTENDIPNNMLILMLRSMLVILLAAGFIGTIFGALTARGMVKRLQQLSDATDAWSKGDFSGFINDYVRDEIGQLSQRLNNMAQQLQHLLKNNQEMAVSEERNRLARDLHDSAKQEALAASFHLGTTLTLFESDPQEAKKHLIEADNLVDSVRKELTDLIHELRPPSINDENFDETLNEYLMEWAHQNGIGATINVEGVADISLDIKQAIYRIMQESLANIARHSSANNVNVQLNLRDKLVEFSVKDDGSGFDLQQQFPGMGLKSMRERAEALDGTLVIESDVKQGTKIFVVFPIT